MSRASERGWVYPRFTDPIASRLAFDLEAEGFGDVEPGTWAEWKAKVGEDWSRAEPEIKAVCAAGARRGGVFGYPEGAGPANDYLMEVYDLIETQPGQAMRMLEARVDEVPEDLDAWVSMAQIHQEMGSSRAGLRVVTRALAIAEAPLPAMFKGAIEYGMVINRPFHRCLHTFAVLAREAGALQVAAAACVAELWLNPRDNMGARYELHEIRSAEATYSQ